MLQVISKNHPVAITVNPDWFHTNAICNMSDPEEDITWLTDNMALQTDRMGTQMFKYKHLVILDGEPVANVLSHSRNEKFFKANCIKIELLNHVLWSSEWINIYELILENLQATHEKIGRLDIAIDGMNYLPKFLTSFGSQREYNRKVFMKGKASFSAGMLDRRTCTYQHFKIGNGDKKIRVYNKTKELEISHKEYIRKTWELSGLDVEAENWRCELRLNSTALKEISQLDYKNLSNPQYLLEIYKTCTTNFFEFVRIHDYQTMTETSQIRAKSRAKVIDLLQFTQLNIMCLKKVPRAIMRGAYKAKLAIHNAVANVLLHNIQGDDVIHAFCHIKNNLEIYDLWRYYRKRIDDWVNKYQPRLSDRKDSNQDKQYIPQLLLNPDGWTQFKMDPRWH